VSPYSWWCARASSPSLRPCPQLPPPMQLTRPHAGGAAHHRRTPLKLMELALDIDLDVTGPGMLRPPVCVHECISLSWFAFLGHGVWRFIMEVNASKDGSMIYDEPTRPLLTHLLQPHSSLHYASEGVDWRQDGIDVSKHFILEKRTRMFWKKIIQNTLKCSLRRAPNNLNAQICGCAAQISRAHYDKHTQQQLKVDHNWPTPSNATWWLLLFL